MRLFVDHLAATVSPATARQQVLDLLMFLSVCQPEHDWRWIRRLPRLPSEGEAMASRGERAHFTPVQLLLPVLARLDVPSEMHTTPAVAREIRNLVLVIVALHFKPRSRNLIGLRIGETIWLDHDQITICFEGSGTKTGAIIDTVLQPMAAKDLRHYLAEARPALLGNRADPRHLWLQQDGGALSERTAWSIFGKIGERFLGHRISPHDMRRVLATTMLTERPESLRIAAAGLSHRGLAVMLKHYDQSGGDAAEALWRKAVRRARRRTP